MSDAATIIRGAMPDASDSMVEHIVWGRTCLPFGKVTARDLYRAASRVRRAADKGRMLCDLCDNLADGDRYTCARCKAALAALQSEGSDR